MKTTINPVHDYVLVQLEEQPKETTVSGIIVPPKSNMSAGMGRGTVIGFGHKFTLANKGDLVLFGKNEDQRLNINGKVQYLLKWQDIFAVIN